MTLDRSNSLNVSEIFYSIQGEGKTAGCPAIFIRLANCNLLCDGAWLCDTIEVWKKGIRIAFQDVINEFDKHNQFTFYDTLADGAHLVFTGGEPMLQQISIVSFLQQMFYDQDRPHPFIEIETNATIKPASILRGMVNLWNLSPKLFTSGARDSRYNYEVLKFFAINMSPKEIQWKFVVAKVGDWLEIKTQYKDLLNIPNQCIVLMPAASNEEELKNLSQDVAEICKQMKVWFGNRLQIQLWNKTTGV